MTCLLSFCVLDEQSPYKHTFNFSGLLFSIFPHLMNFSNIPHLSIIALTLPLLTLITPFQSFLMNHFVKSVTFSINLVDCYFQEWSGGSIWTISLLCCQDRLDLFQRFQLNLFLVSVLVWSYFNLTFISILQEKC